MVRQLLGDDDALSTAMHNNRSHGLPSIDVPAAQGKVLYLLAKIAGAKRVLDADSKDDMIIGTRKLFAMLQRDEHLDATAIQTVGEKGWDGFILALVR